MEMCVRVRAIVHLNSHTDFGIILIKQTVYYGNHFDPVCLQNVYNGNHIIYSLTISIFDTFLLFKRRQNHN